MIYKSKNITHFEKKIIKSFDENKLIDCHNCKNSLICFNKIPEIDVFFTCDGFEFTKVS